MNLPLTHCVEALISSLPSFLLYHPASTVTQVCRPVYSEFLIQGSLTSFLSSWNYHLRGPNQLFEPLR